MKPNLYQPPESRPTRRPYWRPRPWRFWRDPVVVIFAMLFILAVVIVAMNAVEVDLIDRSHDGSASDLKYDESAVPEK